MMSNIPVSSVALPGGSTAIVLINFRRPLLTSRALLHLRAIAPAIPIVASIDGPYSGNRFRDEMARRETLQVVGRFAEHDFQTSLISPLEGSGIRGHVEFALNEAFINRSFESVILLEEDQVLQPEGLDFLEKVRASVGGSIHATAFSSTQHDKEFAEPRVTLFPEQWGVLINAPMYDSYLALRKRGYVTYREVFTHFLPILESRLKSAIAADYWTALFNETLNSQDQFDGALQAALCSSRTLTMVPWRNGLTDVGGGAGALNERDGPVDVASHKARLRSLTGLGYVCLSCELNSLAKRELDWRMPLRRRMRVRSRLSSALAGTNP